jgi:catechol 2,3-dioxygenase-like lactoylglutathione lyase family enzyme
VTQGSPPRPGAWRLDRIALNVTDISAAISFYCDALGFAVTQAPAANRRLAELLAVRGVVAATLQRGAETLELTMCDPCGAPMPACSRSNDGWFQHCALVTTDIAGDYERLQRFAFTPISRAGPQALPGGTVAYKFRDADGHPLELISLAKPDKLTAGGIDHSAICVADTARSINFYAAALGLAVTARQVNQGPAQDALDGLAGAVVDVVALAPAIAEPHVELLSYRHPRGRVGVARRPGDIAATRLVFARAWQAGEARKANAEAADIRLLHDPDGHALVLTG